MKITHMFFASLPVMVILSACKQKYEPPSVQIDYSILVVDGFLNNSADTTFIRLSRTKKLQDGIAQAEERNASVVIEDNNNTVLYAFQELTPGLYFVPGMHLTINKNYRVRIHTQNNQEYLTEDIVARQTPRIDSVSFQRQDKGVMIYANTHDPQNNTRYYRWDYSETYRFRSFYYSIVKYEDHAVLDRSQNDLVYDCWRTRNATDVLVGTSAKLSQDIIYRSPIRFIPNDAIELDMKYSILLRQYALSRESFEYYENLKKITEELGSIFDAQPTQLTGNIHSVINGNAFVIGFITASSVDSTRIFIDKSQVLPWKYPLFCNDVREYLNDPDTLEFYFKKGSTFSLIEPVSFGGVTLKYLGAQVGCVDCVSRGGINRKPDFWP